MLANRITLTFCGLALAHAFQGFPTGSALYGAAPVLLPAADGAAWLATGLCVLRGAPVIVEGFRDHWLRRSGLASAASPVLPFGSERTEP